MSWFDRLKGWASKALGGTDMAEIQSELLHGGRSGGDMGALQAAQQIPIFWTALQATALKFAQNEWRIDTESDGEPEDVRGTDLEFLVETPNPVFSGLTYHRVQQIYRDAIGRSHAVVIEEDVVEDESSDQPFTLWPVPPTSVRRRKGSWIVEIGQKRFEVSDENMFTVRASPDLESPYSGYQGLAHVVADELETIEAVSESERAFYQNNARADMLIRLPGASEKAKDDFKETWKEKFRGPRRTGMPVVATGGEDDIQFENLQSDMPKILDPAKRDQLRDIVRQGLNVPPQIIGDLLDANRANSYIARRVFAEQNTQPRLKLWASAVNKTLVPRVTESGILVPVSPVPDDKERRLETMKAAPQGSFTVNDWRQMAGFEPDPEGDIYIRPAPRQARIVEAGEPDDGGEPQTDRGQQVTGADEPKELPEDTDKSDVIPIEVISEQEKQADRKATRIAEAIQPEVAREISQGAYEEELIEFTETVAEGQLGVGVKWDLMNPRVKEQVDNYTTNRIVNITKTQRENISDIVRSGFDEGKRGPEIAGAIENHYDEELIPNRAETIGRTEMGIASNRSTLDVHQTSGVVKKREWVAQLDSSTRGAHAELDGQVVGINEPFTTSGGAEAMAPMLFGIAGLDINCRCATVAKVPTRIAPDSRVAAWKQIEAQRRRAEKRFIAIWRQIFREQLNEHLMPKIREVLDLEGAA